MPTINTKLNKMLKNSERKEIVQLNGITYHHKSASDGRSSFEIGSIDINVYEGELIVLLGPSGSGKTTLLRLISGLDWPSEGYIKINDKIVAGNGQNIKPELRHVGMVFQEQALFPHMTVRDNILFGIRSWSKDKKDRRLMDLEELLGLKNLSQRYPHQLSGGQQQRVAIARTLAPKPSVILLDEPLSNVDDEHRSQLASELKSIIKDLGLTAIWVTHDRGEALDLADRLVVLNEGKIEQVDDPWIVYHQPQTRFVADFVGQAVFIDGNIKERMILTEIGCFTNTKSFTEGENIELMVRPEYVQMAPHVGGLGTIVKRQFHGSRQLYTIHLQSGQYLLSSQPSTMIWPEGTRVRVSLDIKEIIAFRK